VGLVEMIFTKSFFSQPDQTAFQELFCYVVIQHIGSGMISAVKSALFMPIEKARNGMKYASWRWRAAPSN